MHQFCIPNPFREVEIVKEHFVMFHVTRRELQYGKNLDVELFLKKRIDIFQNVIKKNLLASLAHSHRALCAQQ